MKQGGDIKIFKYFLITGIFAVIFLFCLAPWARPLDIIIGGDKGGLECKTDKECNQDSYCNQEQYYCVFCKVPPKIWTGTECKCPANKPIEKSETECVECLKDSDCTGDSQFCNTETNTCMTCKLPKEWKENVCACPDKTHESGDTCLCDNPNTNLDEFNFCACTLTPDNCATSDLNLTACMCCPPERPVNVGADCKPCAEIDSSKPLWDASDKTCKSCAQIDISKPVLNPSTGLCEACKAPQTLWSGTKCMCPLGTPTKADPTTCRCARKICPPLYVQDTKVTCDCVCDADKGMVYDNGLKKCICKDAIILPQQTIFAQKTQCNETRLISGPIGPYNCDYKLMVQGHIDDDFLVTDQYGNWLHKGNEQHHNVYNYNVYTVKAGKIVNLYAIDNGCEVIAWEDNGPYAEEDRIPKPGRVWLERL